MTEEEQAAAAGEEAVVPEGPASVPTISAVKDALDGLSDSYRMAVLLADVEGFSYKEIAEILDVPIGTVMSRLHRGRKALQKTLYDVAVARGLVDSHPVDEHADEGERAVVESGRSADG